MNQNSIIRTKNFDFSIRIIKLYKFLKSHYSEYELSTHLPGSGTAIRALIREAERAEIRKDFTHKISIGLKDANESVYWLEFLCAKEYISKKMFESMIPDATELLKMLIASVKTIKKQLANNQ